MLEKVKLALRVSGDAFDDEIEGIIESAKLDLQLAGVSPEKLKENDALITRAIIVYAKSQFGMANPDSEKYDESYHNIRQKLALSGLHNVLE